MTNTTNKASEVNAWRARRTDKGIHPNADEIWDYINRRWPTLSEPIREDIFQKNGRVTA